MATWHEITDYTDPHDGGVGHRTWRAVIERGCPWDPGDLFEHTLLVGYDGDWPVLGYNWQTVLNDRAGGNDDAGGYAPTLAEAQAAAERAMADQPNLGVEPDRTPVRRSSFSDRMAG